MWLTLSLPLLCQNAWKSRIQHWDTSLWITHPLHINNGFSLFSSKLSCYKGFSDWNHCHTVLQYFQCDVLMQWYTSDTHSTNRPLMWGWWVDEGSRSSFPFHITQSTSHWVSELWQSNAVQEAWCLLCGESLPSLLSSYLKTLNGYANRELVFIHYLHSSHTSHQNMLNLLVMARCWLVPQHKNWVLPH